MDSGERKGSHNGKILAILEQSHPSQWRWRVGHIRQVAGRCRQIYKPTDYYYMDLIAYATFIQHYNYINLM